MAKILSFHWDSTNKCIDYFLYDDNTTSIDISFTQNNITTQTAAQTCIDNLYNNVQAFSNIASLKIRYKILHSSPVAQHSRAGYGPNPLSLFIKNHFDQKFSEANDIEQRKSKLKGNELKKFKSALKDFQLLSTIKGSAYKAHLWSFCLEIKKSGFKDTLKKLWKIKQGINSRISQAQTQAFEQWYRAL